MDYYCFLRMRSLLVSCVAAATVTFMSVQPGRLVAAEPDGEQEVELSLTGPKPSTDVPVAVEQPPAAVEPPADAAPAAKPSQPAVDKPAVAEQPAAKEPAKEQAAKEPAPETAATTPTAPEPPVTKQSATKEPAAKQTVAKPAAPKKPVLIPGTGTLVKGGSDDFEDEKWKWYYNHPKSSEEQDKRMRGPVGKSANGLWFEGPKRGTPDVVKRIELPAPGLEGSGHGLLISTLAAGIPGRVTYQMQQDDLVFNMQRAAGRGMYVADSPSVVVRVYMPPFEQWENRSGPSFGFRAGCYTHAIITGDDHPDEGRFGLEEYWPGMFVCFESSTDKRYKEDGAYIRVRGGRNGGEIAGPRISELGWWTLGLSFSPDGMVHYFASPGVDDLTMDDHITSQYPYGYRTEWLKTYFFNVCSRDDGRTWSTPWVIDDPKAYFVKRPQMATTPSKKR